MHRGACSSVTPPPQFRQMRDLSFPVHIHWTRELTIVYTAPPPSPILSLSPAASTINVPLITSPPRLILAELLYPVRQIAILKRSVACFPLPSPRVYAVPPPPPPPPPPSPRPRLVSRLILEVCGRGSCSRVPTQQFFENEPC